IELPLMRIAVAKRIHFRKFFSGIDMHDGERHAAEERFACEPDHHIGVFTERPQQRHIAQTRIGLAQNEDTLRFKLIEPIHHGHPAPTSRRASSRPTRAHSFFAFPGICCSKRAIADSRIFFYLIRRFPLYIEKTSRQWEFASMYFSILVFRTR